MADPVDYTSLPASERFPHVPAGWAVKADPEGGDTCAEVAPVGPIAPESRFPAGAIAKAQWVVERMGLDADGVPGAYNDAYMDNWYPYNAKGSLNYADAASFKVVSVSGKTLTLQTLDLSDAGVITRVFRRVPNPDYGAAEGLPRYLTETVTGCVQPGMVVQFSGNSVITNTCRPVIVKVVSCSGDTLVVETDKVMTAAMSKFAIDDGAGGTMPDPSDVTCKVWHFAGNAPTWRKIVKPDFFGGVRRTMAIKTVPTDGIVELSAKSVKDNRGFDPLSPTWTLEGKRIDDATWETVGDQDQRLYVLPLGPSRVALKTTKPAEGDTAPGSDLTETYSEFRATFWEDAA